MAAMAAACSAATRAARAASASSPSRARSAPLTRSFRDGPHEGRELAARDAPVLDGGADHRSEEHTSELQSPCNLVCRLLLEKKKNTQPRFDDPIRPPHNECSL